jgi:hypothetical protein
VPIANIWRTSPNHTVEPSQSSSLGDGLCPIADPPPTARAFKNICIEITPAVDRLSRDTTDLLVIAREMQRVGAGIRSLAEPFLDATSDFAEIIFAILVEKRMRNVICVTPLKAIPRLD